MAKKMVKFNVKNLRVAELIVSELGAVSYGDLLNIPGTVSIGMEAQNGESTFYADGIKYWSKINNNGYEGTINNADLSDNFREKFLGDLALETGILAEVQEAVAKEFGMMFDIDTSEGPVTYIYYNCLAARPSNEFNTVEEEIEPTTDELTLSIKTIPVSDKNLTKLKVTSKSAKFDGLKTSLYVPETLTVTP